MADEPDLRRGNNDEQWVMYLQGLLEAAGFPPGRIDGDFGPKTEAAVQAFQQANNCTVDGWVGPQTWGALNALGLTAVQAGQEAAAQGGAAGDGGGGDVPADLVAAGAPAQYSQWTEAQAGEFFKQAEVDEPAQGDSDNLEAVAMSDSGDGGSYA